MTRPRGKPICVWATADERAEIQRLARATGLSQSAYLRTVGLGYEPASAFDADAVLALARIHADQGRLGGLLKLSLSQGEGGSSDFSDLLRHLQATQAKLLEAINRVHRRP
ncbi:plasmid mobilization protein [Anaeromyxobacter diazotrophicus]|uniref:plasmid mobilization protein n=1 Tax=Anaeromyxobacter diazotrophicus TaxID=2590199 RepID=UPI001AD8CDF6